MMCLLRRANRRLVNQALRGFFGYPYLNLVGMAELERQGGVLATYNLLTEYGVPEPKTPVGIWRILSHLLSRYLYLRLSHKVVNADYQLADKRVQEQLKVLQEQGFEIGLHLSYQAIPEHRVQQELDAIQHIMPREIVGTRPHYLHFRTHDFYRQLEGTSLRYDSSLIPTQFCGYRTGTSRPHLIFDHDHDRPFSTLSIPLHYMESHYIRNLVGDKTDVETAWQQLKFLLDTTHSRKTLLSVLTHNWLFADPATRRLYDNLLAYIRDKQGIGITAKAVYEWWMQYNQVST